jgi:hypothetical protein
MNQIEIALTNGELYYMLATVWGAKGKQERSRDETREVVGSFSVLATSDSMVFRCAI